MYEPLTEELDKVLKAEHHSPILLDGRKLPNNAEPSMKGDCESASITGVPDKQSNPTSKNLDRDIRVLIGNEHGDNIHSMISEAITSISDSKPKFKMTDKDKIISFQYRGLDFIVEFSLQPCITEFNVMKIVRKQSGCVRKLVERVRFEERKVDIEIIRREIHEAMQKLSPSHVKVTYI